MSQGEEYEVEESVSVIIQNAPTLCSFFNNHKKKMGIVAGAGILAPSIWGTIHLVKNPDRADEIWVNCINTITDPKYRLLLLGGAALIIIISCYLLCCREKQNPMNAENERGATVSSEDNGSDFYDLTKNLLESPDEVITNP